MSGQPPSRMGAAQRPWAFTASAYGDVIPDDDDYLSAVAWADRRWLHLEGRYNYEDLKTGSVCAGANFSVGHDAWLDVTPMLGGVFGQTSGIAPAYRVAAGYGIVDAYSEGEYLVAGDSTDNFFYAWSELGVTPLAWLRIGGDPARIPGGPVPRPREPEHVRIQPRVGQPYGRVLGRGGVLGEKGRRAAAQDGNSYDVAEAGPSCSRSTT